MVELSTGERGIVVMINPLDALRPSVKIMADSTQQPYATAMTVDLADHKPNEPERTILRVLETDKELSQTNLYTAADQLQPVQRDVASLAGLR